MTGGDPVVVAVRGCGGRAWEEGRARPARLVLSTLCTFKQGEAMTGNEFDVVVVGGGPAGACAATVLASAGLRVLVLEKERFPRFHVGESLLPAAWPLWDRLGVTKEIEEAGFVVKQGINFGMFNQPEQVVLRTAEYPDYFQRPYTFHVERAKFDEILLDNAARKGADVRQEWTVADVIMDGDRAVARTAP